MHGLDRLWAGWRSEYIESAGGDDHREDGCVFCSIMASGSPDEETFVVWRGESTVAILNAYPYTSGHLMVMPIRHVSGLGGLEAAESVELFGALTSAVAALESAYRPEGINLGANLGRAAGAGIPAHLHMHALPRWLGDSNFMTSIAEARVLPEALARDVEEASRRLAFSAGLNCHLTARRVHCSDGADETFAPTDGRPRPHDGADDLAVDGRSRADD